MLIALLLFAQALPEEFFESKVRPIFAARCYQCHGEKVKMGGLDLRDGASFKSVIGEPERLVEVLSYEGRVKMPPGGKLGAEEIATIGQWVKAGAKWPAAQKAAAKGPAGKKDHWAFQPIKAVTPPAVKREEWVKRPLDRFILARLEKDGVSPAAAAEKRVLLRRMTYDLTGLPPKPAEVDAFLADTSAEAVDRAMERLLASPQFGEQWGRHWLDVARYADSTGMDEDHLYPDAWRYRDYVVRAMNEDKPFDRFVIEQLAGDLVEGANNDTVIATGFLAVGPRPLAQQDRQKMIYDVVDEQIDTTSRALLGLSVACARCHDHKFDPIPTKDYYGLASIFASTKMFRNLGRPGSVSYMYEAPLDRAARERYDAHRRKVDESFLTAEEAALNDRCARVEAQLKELPEYLVAAYEMRRHGKTARAVDLSKLEKFLCLDGLTYFKEANDQNAVALAKEYADKYTRRAREWEERLWRWLARYKEEVIQDRDRPGKPVFDPVDDPFFDALTFHGGPFDLTEPEGVKTLRAAYERLKSTLPAEPEKAIAVCDGAIVEQPIFVRGDNHNPGAVAPKAFPSVLGGETSPAVKGSGRLELARWVVNPKNPLPARVIVNRVWQWHFGEPLMRTPNNWGTTGERPTHPELLDYLATGLMEHGWSLKWLHREILKSATYQMGPHATAEALAKDPGNRLFSRFPRRRMTIEELRDSLLAMDGSLDGAMGGSLLNPDRRKRRRSFDDITRRTMYLPVRRGSIPTLLSVFDYGDATTVSEGRARTNVAPQALFLMNSDFVQARAVGLARRLEGETGGSDREMARAAFRTILGREATGGEIDEALTFVEASKARLSNKEAAWASYSKVLLNSNEFIYLN